MGIRSVLTCFRTGSLLVLAIVAVAGPAGAATCNPNERSPGVTGTEIKLGATMPLTGSAAAGGQGASAGARAYYAMVNAAGGVHGRKIAFTVLDDEYSPAVAER